MSTDFVKLRVENQTFDGNKTPIKKDSGFTVTNDKPHSKSPSADITKDVGYEDLFQKANLQKIVSFQVDELHVGGSKLKGVPWDPIPKLPTNATCIVEVDLVVTESRGSFLATATYYYDGAPSDSASVDF